MDWRTPVPLVGPIARLYVFPTLSCTDWTLDAVSFQPTATTFRLPGVCGLAYVTDTVALGTCGVASATWTKLMAAADEAAYVNPAGRVPLCPSAFVTVTFTAPAACGGVVAVMVVLLTT